MKRFTIYLKNGETKDAEGCNELGALFNAGLHISDLDQVTNILPQK